MHKDLHKKKHARNGPKLVFIYCWFTASLTIFFTGCLDPSAPGNLVPATVIEDAALPVLDVNGTYLHCKTFGDSIKPVIVVLHGGPGGDSRELYSLMERHDDYSIADEYYMVIWDQRGTGLSQRHSDPSLLTLSVYLNDLEMLVDKIARTRQVILLGHSWGGMYAAMYMNAHPERVAGAILMESGPFSSDLAKLAGDYVQDYSAEWLNDLVWARQLIGMNDHETADYTMAISFCGNKQSDNPYPMWRMGTAVLIFLGEELSKEKYDFTTNLQKVTPEMLFIVGGKQGSLGQSFQEHQIGYFNRSRLAVIPDADHDDIVWAKAHLSIAVIREYLDSLTIRANNR